METNKENKIVRTETKATPAQRKEYNRRKGKKRPNIWNDSIPKRAYRLALLGLTDEELAVAFGVSERTLRKWTEKYPQFTKALTLGRSEADSKVALSLFNRAIGYKTTEMKIHVVDGTVVTTEIDKEVPADVTAAIFWLKNRQKDKWADIWKVDHSGFVDMQLPENDLSDISTEDLKAMKNSILLKQLEDNNN